MAYFAKNKIWSHFTFLIKFWTNSFGKIPIFRFFLASRFDSLESIFHFENIVTQISVAFFAKNKKMAKCDLFDRNHGLKPLEKSQFLGFFNLVFVFVIFKGFFFRKNIVKNTFFWTILQKLKLGQTLYFWPKPWTNPFKKIPIFWIFKLLVFIVLKAFFLFLKYCQTHFLAYFAKTKNMAKFHIFHQNNGLTPLKKSQFFDFLNFSFLLS